MKPIKTPALDARQRRLERERDYAGDKLREPYIAAVRALVAQLEAAREVKP